MRTFVLKVRMLAEFFSRILQIKRAFNLVVFFIVLSMLIQTTSNFMSVPEQPTKIHFNLVFHANQAAVPYSDIANDLNYYHVLKTLRKHPSIPITLHFSGTLNRAEMVQFVYH